MMNWKIWVFKSVKNKIILISLPLVFFIFVSLLLECRTAYLAIGNPTEHKVHLKIIETYSHQVVLDKKIDPYSHIDLPINTYDSSQADLKASIEVIDKAYFDEAFIYFNPVLQNKLTMNFVENDNSLKIKYGFGDEDVSGWSSFKHLCLSFLSCAI